MSVALFAGFASAHAGNRTDELIAETLLLTPDMDRGRSTYRKLCAGCHGRKGWGRASKATPALAAQRVSYLVKQMIDFTELERDVPEMHRLFADPRMSDPQRFADLAAYLNQLEPNERPQQGNSRALPLGGNVYALACAQCHGDAGEGSEGAFVPALRGQHYSYLLLQMRALATGHRFNTSAEVLDLLDSLSAEQMAAVADFATRLTAPDGETE